MCSLLLRHGDYFRSVTFHAQFAVCITCGEQKLLVAVTNNNASLDYLTRRLVGICAPRDRLHRPIQGVSKPHFGVDVIALTTS